MQKLFGLTFWRTVLKRKVTKQENACSTENKMRHTNCHVPLRYNTSPFLLFTLSYYLLFICSYCCLDTQTYSLLFIHSYSHVVVCSDSLLCICSYSHVICSCSYRCICSYSLLCICSYSCLGIHSHSRLFVHSYSLLICTYSQMLIWSYSQLSVHSYSLLFLLSHSHHSVHSYSLLILRSYCLLSVLDQVLWVNLVFLKDNKNRRVELVIHTAVIEQEFVSRPLGGTDIGGIAFNVVSNQNTSHEHQVSHACGLTVGVGIAGISSEVAPWKTRWKRACEENQ